MHCGGMLRCFVLCIGVRRVLVQRLGRTMMLCTGKRRPGKHEQEQYSNKQLLHATNLARRTRCRGHANEPRTKTETISDAACHFSFVA